MKSTTIALLAVLMFVVFVIGGGLGIIYQSQKDAPQLNKAAEVLRKLSSKAVPSIVVYGQISKIEGKNLTVSFEEESVAVETSNDTVITSFAVDAEGKTSQQTINLSQVEQGQTASISVRLSPDGQLQANSVIIMPARGL